MRTADRETMMAKKVEVTQKLKGMSLKARGSDGKPPRSPGTHDAGAPPPPEEEAGTPASHNASLKEVISPPCPASPVASNVSTNIDLALERLSAPNKDGEDNDSIMGFSTEGDLDQFGREAGDTDDEDVGDLGGDSDDASDDDYYHQDYSALALGDRTSDILSDDAPRHRRVTSREVRELTHPETPEVASKRKVHEHEDGGDYADFYVDVTSPLELAKELPQAEYAKPAEETKGANNGEEGDMPVLPEDEEFHQDEGKQVPPLLATVRRKANENKAAQSPASSSVNAPKENAASSTSSSNDNGEKTDFAAAMRMFGGTTKKTGGHGSPGRSVGKLPKSLVEKAGSPGRSVGQFPKSPVKEKQSRALPQSVETENKNGDKQEVPKTPDANKELPNEIDDQLVLTGRSSLDSGSAALLTPGASPDAKVSKLVKDNQKLRKRRKELLALLSSTAQQFSSYEKVCSKKISALEERNRELERKVDPAQSGAEDALRVARAASLPDATNENPEGANGTQQYGEDIVRRLSSGVLMQEKQLKSKDETISQLKLRCEVLKQNLADKDSEMAEEKKLWEEERSMLGTSLDGDSPTKEGHGDALASKLKVKRMKKELESALGDITMLTSALEKNNETLDATVLELDKLKQWKANQGEGQDVERTDDAETGSETTQLQKDLESSRNKIEELKASIDAAAKAKGYEDFQNVVEGLTREAAMSKDEADKAKVRIVELEAELAAKRGGEAGASATGDVAPATPSDSAPNGVARASLESPQTPTQGLGLFGRLRAIGNSPMTEEETSDYRTMVRQRDLKIKSLEAMVHSNTRIVEKLRADIERMDNEKEEVQFESTRRIEELEQENRTYEMQVKSFEKAFMNLNDQHRPSLEVSAPIVDDNMFMWDEEDGEPDDEPDGAEEASELRQKNLELIRTLAEMEATGSGQEDQIERLKADLVKLSVKSQLENEQLRDENEIVTAQRSALENQLVEINKSARDSLSSPPATPQQTNPFDDDDDDDNGGSDPVLVAQVVMLEKKNKVLESSVDCLRSDAQAKLAPLLTRIAELEQEKEIFAEEMQTKVQARENTISSLEGSLKQLHKKASKKASRSTKMLKGKIGKNQSSSGEF
ncbi:hypothetical protein ACHAXT_007907 [Thalassiosira profunda]